MGFLNALESLVGMHHAPARHLVATSEGPTGTAGGALPPPVVDGPHGPVNYLSTLQNPQERQQTQAMWQRNGVQTLRPIFNKAQITFTNPNLGNAAVPVQSAVNPGYLPLQRSNLQLNQIPQFNAFTNPQQTQFNPQVNDNSFYWN